jgi:hypothetical protein
MAASIVVPARTSLSPRGLAARAAARTAPQGPGLAAVVALPVREPVGGPVGGDVAAASVAMPIERSQQGRPELRLVAPLARRRLVGPRLIGLLLVAALLVGGVAGLARGAFAAPEDPVVAGHVVLQPGETLWDVAVRSAPVGVDPRRQLDTLRRLNGFGPGALDAWTVVLIPAA